MFVELNVKLSYSQINAALKEKAVKVHSSVKRHCPGNEHSRVHLLSLSSTLVLMSKWQWEKSIPKECTQIVFPSTAIHIFWLYLCDIVVVIDSIFAVFLSHAARWRKHWGETKTQNNNNWQLTWCGPTEAVYQAR